MNAIVEFWQARSARERLLLGILAAVLAVALWFFTLVDPLMQRADHFEQKLVSEQALLQRVEALRGRRATLPPTRSRSDTSLLLSANRTLQEAGLSAYLEEGNADGERRVQLRLKDAPFPEISAWLLTMAVQEGVRTISADIEPAESPGLVQITLVLERTGAHLPTHATGT